MPTKASRSVVGHFTSCCSRHWCQAVQEAFAGGARRKVGQVGLRTDQEENHVRTNTGGNNIILRELFDLGLRYDEKPWPQYPPGCSEDTYLSPAVLRMGYQWTRVSRHVLDSLATNDWDDPYYQKSFGDRRIRKGTVKPIER